MVDAAKTPNVVEACNKPGLYETLEDTQRRYIARPCLHVWFLGLSFLDHSTFNKKKCTCKSRFEFGSVYVMFIPCLPISRLAVCEKALAEYLETKRLAFPRFYFVSSADLLDILSKGNQPPEVYIYTCVHFYISCAPNFGNINCIYHQLSMSDTPISINKYNGSKLQNTDVTRLAQPALCASIHNTLKVCKRLSRHTVITCSVSASVHCNTQSI